MMDPDKNELIQKYTQSNAFGKLIGMHFEISKPGEVDYSLVVGKNHLATPHAAHGGLIAALVDGAMGVAALSAVCLNNKVISTVEYKTNFLAPAFLGDHLIGKAKVEQLGRRLVIVSCDVLCVNRENKVIAKALGTFNAYDADKAGY